MTDLIKRETDFNFNEFKYMVYRSILPRKTENISPRKNWALYYIIKGTLEVVFKNETITLSDNDYMFFDFKEKYKLRNASDNPATIYIISYDFIDEKASHADFDLPKYGVLEKNNIIYTLLQRLFSTWIEKKPGYLIKCRSIYLNIIYNILNISDDSPVNFYEYSKLQSAIRYIQSNYQNDIRLEELSDISNYSQTHIRRLFLKYFGMSPVKYITKFRINRALLLLDNNNDLSVANIAQKVGFNDVCYFSKTFKKITGYTPMEYKNMNLS